MSTYRNACRVAVVAFAFSTLAGAEEPEAVVIEDSMVHLRNAPPREWTSFPQQPQAASLDRHFESAANTTPWTLSLRQQDVKQGWEVRLNDRSLGRLVRDESDLRSDFDVPVGGIVDGENRLEIRCSGRDADDVRVGQIELRTMDAGSLRSMCTIEVVLTDESDTPIPGRITIVDQHGALVPVGADSGDRLAVRDGVVYTSTGNARFGVAPGAYRIFGTRGFEYSLGSTLVSVATGEHAKRTLQLQREVDTEGWIACDTHVHTVTHSGHGDCSMEERMVTLAAEGIELPIATDHNKQIDYGATAKLIGVESQFTSVIGNEVTTKKGHFNIFPVDAGSETPDHNQQDWGPLLDDIFSTPGVRVAILNHARDIHGGFRPFSPRHHISLTGENLDDRPMRFNAMEVINSGAVQTDSMELFADWCGLINRGLDVTPVGSSDSHDVSRYIVGQGRTYIQCDDSDVSKIDVSAAVDAFLGGRVVVSYGLLTRLAVNQTYGPGDLVTLADPDDELVVTVEVYGPRWTQADSVELYVCGRLLFAEQIEATSSQDSSTQNSSLKKSVTWRVPRTDWKHDVWLTAVARGPGIDQPYWATAKPYQPDSPDFSPYVFSSTGPIRIDVDGDGDYTSPLGYAQQLVHESDGYASGTNASGLARRLEHFDPSVVHQVASLLQAASVDLAEVQAAAGIDVGKAIADFRQAWRASTNARLEQIE